MSEKKKKKSSLLYRIIIAVLVVIIGFSLYKVATIGYEYYIGTKEYNKLAELAGVSELTEGAEKAMSVRVNFDALQKKNKDVKAWLFSEDTVINYPVVQGKDNQYYLYRMINGEWNGKGSLFIDYRNKEPFKDFNTIIYGHRMKDGSMFHSLVDYRSKSYFDQHKKMVLFTPEKTYDVEIFGVVTIPADSDKYKMDFYSNSEKQAYLSWIKDASEINTGVVPSVKDRIVMLSTCTYEYEDARLVVYGRLKERKDA